MNLESRWVEKRAFLTANLAYESDLPLHAAAQAAHTVQPKSRPLASRFSPSQLGCLPLGVKAPWPLLSEEAGATSASEASLATFRAAGSFCGGLQSGDATSTLETFVSTLWGVVLRQLAAWTFCRGGARGATSPCGPPGASAALRFVGDKGFRLSW